MTDKLLTASQTVRRRLTDGAGLFAIKRIDLGSAHRALFSDGEGNDL
jgi:hypothetical protein